MSHTATTCAPGSSRKLETLFMPCQPVPMHATVIRSLGAIAPSRPIAGSAAAPADRRNVRRFICPPSDRRARTEFPPGNAGAFRCRCSAPPEAASVPPRRSRAAPRQPAASARAPAPDAPLVARTTAPLPTTRPPVSPSNRPLQSCRRRPGLRRDLRIVGELPREIERFLHLVSRRESQQRLLLLRLFRER